LDFYLKQDRRKDSGHYQHEPLNRCLELKTQDLPKNGKSKSTVLPLFFRFLKKRFLFRGERVQNMWFVLRKTRGKTDYERRNASRKTGRKNLEILPH
jgi:hypothetical protein